MPRETGRTGLTPARAPAFGHVGWQVPPHHEYRHGDVFPGVSLAERQTGPPASASYRMKFSSRTFAASNRSTGCPSGAKYLATTSAVRLARSQYYPTGVYASTATFAWFPLSPLRRGRS